MELSSKLILSGIVTAMGYLVDIIGAGLAGSEAALQLANRGIKVRLFEMRPERSTTIHRSGCCAELVCSNSLKAMKPDSAAGMLKKEMSQLNSFLLATAFQHQVPAGGALAVNRDAFAQDITKMIESHSLIDLIRTPVSEISHDADVTIIASGPLTSPELADYISQITGQEHLAFYDAAAPIVMADSLDFDKLFSQSRYEEGQGDYLNAPFNKEEYEEFIHELLQGHRVIKKDFETAELFQACQPLEEIARKGKDAPRFGAMKPVGLLDPQTGRRPWAALQLRAENEHKSSYNLVGFQTNLTFGEQERVFRMIPGLRNAEFARFGVMHRNTFVNAPQLLDRTFRVKTSLTTSSPIYIAGQLSGTEGYCEAIMSGLYVALSAYAHLKGVESPLIPAETASGALFEYATNPETKGYQPMHVNFGIVPPLEQRIKNKKERYGAYAARGNSSFAIYLDSLRAQGLLIKDGN